MPGIPLSANFDLGTGIPLDSRLVQVDITARDALSTITQRYEGMPVFVIATGKNYQLRGGVEDANWVELIDVGEPALGNPGTNGYVLSSTTAGVRSWVAQSSGVVPVSDILYWNSGTSKYTPYADNTEAASAGKFYLGTTFVAAADLRLNYTGGICVNSASNAAIVGQGTDGTGVSAISGSGYGIFASSDTGITARFNATLGNTSDLIEASVNNVTKFTVNKDGTIGLVDGTQAVSINNRYISLSTAGVPIATFSANVANDSGNICHILGTSLSMTASGIILLSVRNNNTEKVSIDKDGNINLASGATYKIGGNAISLSKWVTTGSDIYYNTGNVGIGTVSPTNKFHVVSDAEFSGAASAQGVFSGTGTNFKYIAIGYDTTNDFGYIQVANENVTWNKLLVLQPNGGTIQIGNGTSAGDLVIGNNCSALSFTDRTPFYKGNALLAISKIKAKGDKIDHSTLPRFVRVKRKTKTGTESVRDIGAMISVLTVAVQQLLGKIEKLEKLKKNNLKNQSNTIRK